MPGITNFTLNTINRNSLDIECGVVPCNNYVNTGDSTELEQGKTYFVSITHTRDSVILPNVRNNIRIWIDYNNNDTLDDAGETVLSLDYQTFGTSTDSFTVPLTANIGNTRMRVTMKMSDEGGHSLPTPCDIPPDPTGYHGEFEDYKVKITKAPTGIGIISEGNSVNIFPNPTSGKFKIQSKSKISKIEIINLLGSAIYSSDINAYKADIDLSDQTKGIYIYTLTAEEKIIGRGKIVLE